MVAKFETGSSLSKTLNYNEQKVQKGVAEFLTAENYPMDNHLLSFYHKLSRLENQAALNENVTRNSVHISLNFDPSEKLEKEKLIAIANTYMEQIGFGEQPYLVYQHHDAGHPHIHIVSVKVRADGRRVDTQNIGKNQSEKARKEIEIAFNLVKAEDSKLKETYKLEPVNAQKVQYGKTETKRAIGNVLKTVLDTYKYGSLAELNTLLKLYNVMADRGGEGSKMYNNNGLMYRVLDEQGNKVGAPIKASQFYMQPTLKKLAEKFEKNQSLKNPHRTRVKNAIDMALLKNPKQSLQSLIKNLEREGIATVLRQNETGRIYGITYIDHKTKAVFNGSDLGKHYSSNAMQERCAAAGKQQPETEKQQASTVKKQPGAKKSTAASGMQPEGQKLQEHMPSATQHSILLDAIADALSRDEYTGDTLPFELKKSRKKKRKRLSNNQ